MITINSDVPTESIFPRMPVPATSAEWVASWEAFGRRYGHSSVGTVENPIDLSRWVNLIKQVAQTQSEISGAFPDRDAVYWAGDMDPALGRVSRAWFLAHPEHTDVIHETQAAVYEAAANALPGQVLRTNEIVDIDPTAGTAYRFTGEILPLIDMAAANPSVPAVVSDDGGRIMTQLTPAPNTSIPRAAPGPIAAAVAEPLATGAWGIALVAFLGIVALVFFGGKR